jgi:hypothetical protein
MKPRKNIHKGPPLARREKARFVSAWSAENVMKRSVYTGQRDALANERANGKAGALPSGEIADLRRSVAFTGPPA